MLQESGLNRAASFNTPAWSISVEVFCYALFFVIYKRYSLIALPLAVTFMTFGMVMTLGNDPSIDHIARGVCGFFAGVITYRLRNISLKIWCALFLLGLAIFPQVHGVSRGTILSLTCWPALIVVAPYFTFLSSRIFVWLGDRSYSIYLIHSPIYMLGNIVVFGGSPVSSEWRIWTMMLAWVVVLALSDLSYRYMEAPARKWLRIRCQGSRPSTDLAPA